MHIYNRYSIKLKGITRKSIKRQNFEAAMAAMSAYCNLAYNWNQFYADDEIENQVSFISEQVFDWSKLNDYNSNSDTILFYDGFGLDTRGLALHYLNALKRNGKRIIYVVPVNAKGGQPTIMRLLHDANVEIVHLVSKKHIEIFNELIGIFLKYRPGQAFFYSHPSDVAGAAAFHVFESKAIRYQINLTDHAFWVGKCAFDYCLEFREYGTGISVGYRGIAREKLRYMPYYPWVDKSVEFQGFDFDTKGKKILFSGGSLYKTIGGDNKYYKIVGKVLEENKDVIFLYAGTGDDSELKKLAAKWGERVQHIAERKDLFALLQHVDVYLNTYPMVGGLMTQYAAMSGKPPIMLNDNGSDDASGLLISQDKLNIEFSSVDDVVNEINKLLSDEQYAKRRGEEVKKGVITEEQFNNNLSNIMLGKSEPPIECKCPDTSDFRKEYIGRFSKLHVYHSIVRRTNISLFKYFPLCFFKAVVLKALHKYDI